MKHLFTTIAIASSAILFTSCGVNVLHGEGKKTTQSPTVAGNFDAVDIRISSDVKITVSEGSTAGVRYSGYENIIKHIKTEMNGNTLVIDYDLDDTWNVEADDLKVNITVPVLTAVAVSGAPDVDIEGDVKGEALDIDVSGASSITIENIHTNRLTADMSGVAGLEIKGGMVRSASYELSGAGKIEAFNLLTEETKASISGTGKGEVNVSQKLVADISGAGAIKYKGDPQVSKQISGVGSISKED